MDEYVTKEQIIDWYRPYGHTDEPIQFETMVSDLRDMDSADVAPVVHGRWVHEHTSEGYAWVMCSECETVIHKILINKRLNYCPNCGAKMDGERKGEANES